MIQYLYMPWKLSHTLTNFKPKIKLEEIGDEEAIELLKSSIINGREGFFCLKSNKNLTLEKALEIYREKDYIEKIFNSLKNEMQIKPLRVWSDNSIYGVIILIYCSI